MTQDNSQDNVQQSQENQAQTSQETPSDPNVVWDMMKYKTQRNELREEIAKYKAKNEERRTKKLEEEGRHKEVIAEQSSTIDKLNAKLEAQNGIVNNYKQNLINGITSESERQEHLQTKSVDFLEELSKEKESMKSNVIANPQESVGSVRQKSTIKSNWADLDPKEAKATWAERVAAYTKK